MFITEDIISSCERLDQSYINRDGNGYGDGDADGCGGNNNLAEYFYLDGDGVGDDDEVPEYHLHKRYVTPFHFWRPF